MRVVNCGLQGGPEWKAARCGLITASRISDVLSFNQPSAAVAKENGFKLVREAVAAGLKGAESGEREGYRMELVAERLTGQVDDSVFQTKWLREGTEQEPYARAAYEVATGNYLDQHSFVLHPEWDFTGASPDGICGRGGVQIKCPKSTTHLKWMDAGIVPPEHVPQMMWEIECFELDWLDFVSYDARMLDEDLQLFIVRLHRDEETLKTYREAVDMFNIEITDQIERLYARLRGDSVQGSDDGVRNPNLLQSLRASLDACGDTGTETHSG